MMKHETEQGYHRVRMAMRSGSIEWRTLMLILGCYAAWIMAGMLHRISGVASVALLALVIVLHSSLQHEAVHRHPTRHAGWNEALVFLPLGLIVPFRRYRNLHLKHHNDSRLTDPYDDPESYYLALYDYQRLPTALRMLLDWNNRMVVRMLIGPAISATGFLATELRAATRSRDDDVSANEHAWSLHAIGLIVVAAIVHYAFKMPAYAYLASTYLGLSLLAIRSFCEHRWAETPDGRTVIVERSLLAFLFLNNNIHLVHHKLPGLPWYALPAAYRTHRAKWQAINDGYVFHSYGTVMREFGLRAKEPVTHPQRARR